jgi:alpha-2-macroglobulin
MKTISLAVTAFLATLLAAPAAPRLVVSTPSLVPESRIDLVLDSPAVEVSGIGGVESNEWIVSTPALPGKIRWKAQNIAEFIPDHAPAIGTTYSFAIAKGLRHLDGTPVPAGTFATIDSEPFRIVASHSPNRWSSEYSPSLSTWMLVFNDGVDPAAVADSIRFSPETGKQIAATVIRATAGEAGYYGREHKSWTARWEAAHAPPASSGEAEIQLPDEAQLPNVQRPGQCVWECKTRFPK